MPRTPLDADPFRQFAAWWADAEVPMVLATNGPAARAVVLEQFDERGFCFWTSSESPTGAQLARDPRAALVWLWDGRQARVEGLVERVSDEENERHWEGRDAKRQLVAFAQSEPVESREELLGLLAAVPDDPPRPSFWVGYRVVAYSPSQGQTPSFGVRSSAPSAWHSGDQYAGACSCREG